MYRVIGADQKEYGPVSAEQLRQWMTEGRVNVQTLTQAEGAAGWKPLSALPEFGIVAPPPLPSAPPPFPSTGAQPLKHSGMAVAGFVCSLLGLFCCCCFSPPFSILGLIFSVIGLIEVNRNPTRLTGKGLAIAGIVLALVGLLMLFAAFALSFWPAFFDGARFHRHWRI